MDKGREKYTLLPNIVYLGRKEKIKKEESF